MKARATAGISEDGHGISYQDLCDIIHARIEEILSLSCWSFPSSDYESIVPAGLVLTGGSSNLSGIEALGRDILKLPVRVGCPQRYRRHHRFLRDPAYATAVGLLLWGPNIDAQHRSGSQRFFGGL